jgi:DNA-binding NarL/FixJ family response regulator
LLVVDGRTAMVNGDAQHALSCAARVLSADEGGIDERLAALDLQARALDFLGRRDDAERAWTLLASQAAAEGRTQAQLRAAVALGKTELFAGRPAARLREAVDLARSAGAFVELAWAEENLAIGLVLSGDREEAVRLLDEAIERCRRLRLDQLAYLLAARGMAETYGGGDAEPFLREAEQLLPTDDLRLHTQSGRGDIAMREGRYADAVRCFMVCRDIMAAMPGIVPMDATCWLVWALAGDGRHDEAAAMLAEARSMPDLGRWHTRPILLDAAEALLAGDGDAVDRIVAANTDQLTPADIALIRLVAAETIDVPTRVAWLREALDFYGEAGMTATAQRVRRLLRAAGAPVPRRRQPHSDAVPASLAARRITAREAEVLRLVEDGLSNAEIAELLVVSVRTIEAHVSSLLTKLQADRRSQLVALGVRNTP